MSPTKADKLYNVYTSIKTRCYNIFHRDYKWYGARGITITDEWLNNYTAFKTWALNNGYVEGLQIDRVNNDGPYSPDNCRWITCKENNNNRRSNKVVIVNGKQLNVTLACDLLGISKWNVYAAIKNGIFNTYQEYFDFYTK